MLNDAEHFCSMLSILKSRFVQILEVYSLTKWIFCSTHNKEKEENYKKHTCKLQCSSILWRYIRLNSQLQFIHEWAIVNLCFLIVCCFKSNVNTQGKTSNHLRNIWLFGQPVWIWFHSLQLLFESLWSSIWVAFSSSLLRSLTTK